MKLRNVEMLHALFRTGAISRAARLLGISQPAASKLVRHAEQQLGFPLFERIKGRLVPTREAELLAPEVEKLFRQLDQVRRLAQNLGPERHGRIRLGCIPSLGLSIVPAAIRAFQLAHPDVQYEVVTQHSDELVAGLLAQEIDIALAYNLDACAGIHVEQLCRGHLVYIQRDPGPAEIRLEEVRGRPLIGLVSDDPLGRLIRQHLTQAGLSVSAQIEVQTYYIAHALVAKGCGASIVDVFTARSLQAEGLCLSRIRPLVSFDLIAMHNELRPLPRPCGDFLAEVRRQCRQFLAEGERTRS